MVQFAFILGKNRKLSIAELIAYFKSRSLKFKVIEKDSFLIVDIDRPLLNIDDLGGTIKIAQIILSAESKDIRSEVEQKSEIFKSIFSQLPHKVIFGISCYGLKRQDQKLLSDFFKNFLSKEGIKSHYVKPKVGTALSHVEVIKNRLVEKYFEFIICFGKKLWLGRTIGVHNPFEFQKRDIERPFQRTIFSIPPRLCRIMINLSQSRSGLLLDPFCGIGSILQEAALMGFDIWGMDIDSNCVKGCIDNLKWLEREYGIKIGDIEKKIFVGNAAELSKYFAKNSIDVIVTEPFLGPPLKRRPSHRLASAIVNNLVPLYKRWLAEMVKVLKRNKYIVIVSPAFKVRNAMIKVAMDKIAKESGAQLISSFMDYEKRHKTLRVINVIKKP
jgi:tRNA G10  N-methylase Trm11